MTEELVDTLSIIESAKAADSTTTKQPNDEDVNELLLNQFLKPTPNLSWDILNLIQNESDLANQSTYSNLLAIPEPLDSIMVKFKRVGIEGKITNYSERLDPLAVVSGDATNSLSLNRAFGSKTIDGSNSFLPFMPGGMDLDEQSSSKFSQTKKSSNVLKLLPKDDDGLYYKPEGLSRGIDIDSINGLKNLVQFESELADQQQAEAIAKKKKETESNIEDAVSKLAIKEEMPQTRSDEQNEVDDLLPDNIIITKSNINKSVKKRIEWAHMVDLNHSIDNFDDLVPNMARRWPFELDTFQKEAVYHLEQNDSVFIAAHTSAGKTVVAEYAIAMAHRNMTKAIYTSPIKALSNQKFRDFKDDFEDIEIGLLTGDVQINPNADCLIMTTEILRSMLYKGADLIRDVEFVIFDEVHYINDAERGVVWEEVIIMLPPHVKFILLSATVPNTFEFADWIGRTKQKDIYVISTPKRPTPLEIFIWAKQELFKIIDGSRNFLQAEFRKHVLKLEGKKVASAGNQLVRGAGARRGGAQRGGTQRGGRGGSNSNNGNTRQKFMNRDGPNKRSWLELVQYLKKNDLLPAVVFVFSKKRCEEYVDTLSSVDYTTAKEKSEIHRFIQSAVSRLKKEDRDLPQILKISEMVKRGIAVHHGGLLPIIKEIIEILFAKSLVKVLFATETFAMGLNLPTRTVVFSELRKHDGISFRNLLPGEFTQMSGRAGRRGLDKTGTVIVMSYNTPLEQLTFEEVTLGVPTKLSSQFRLTYNMILNLLRVEALRVEEMMKRSFGESSTQSVMHTFVENAKLIQSKIDEIEYPESDGFNFELLEDFYSTISEYRILTNEIILQIIDNPAMKKKLSLGRLIVYRDSQDKLRPGFIVTVSNKNVSVLTFDLGKEKEEFNENDYTVPFLSMIPGFMSKSPLPKMQFGASLKKLVVPFEKIDLITSNTATSSANDQEEFSEKVSKLLEYQDQWNEVSWDGLKNITVHELVQRKLLITKQIAETSEYLQLFTHNDFLKNYKILNRREILKKQLSNIQKTISDESLELLPEYNARLEVLKDLAYVDADLNVQLKGRVACEISSGWELIITELVMDNFLGDFSPEEVVALMSCFVYDGNNNKEDDPIPLTPKLELGQQRIKEIIEKVLASFEKHQVLLTSEEENFLQRHRFSLINVVYEWSSGMSFGEIMKVSPESEGTIVRVITRLDEVCRQVKNASSIIGDSELHAKMTESQEKIQRDIVFCASLYL